MIPRIGTCRPPLCRRLCVLLVVTVTLLSGCSGLADLQFRQDQRLQIQYPANLSTVRLPLTVRWRMTGFTPASAGPAASDRGQFAVFVDRYPMAPGQSLRSIVDKQPICRGTDACLEPSYLESVFGIYVTTENAVTINSLRTSDVQGAAGSSHYLTIVLLDTAGNRIGESVWYTGFGIAA